jgi:Family of unknown function (DUF5329)
VKRKPKLASLILNAWLIATILFVSPAHSATPSPVARDEIASLLMRLKASGCQFKRNGAWHSADEAQVHLQRKLDYLLKRGAVATAEQFIERAATKSSVTGQAYLVKCGNKPPVPSAEWLAFQLQVMRAAQTDSPR